MNAYNPFFPKLVNLDGAPFTDTVSKNNEILIFFSVLNIVFSSPHGSRTLLLLCIWCPFEDVAR